MMRRWIGAVAVVLGVTGPGSADEAAPPSVAGHDRQDPACRAWTDGCTICAIDAAGVGHCSTPGIACTPHRITCEATSTDVKKAAPR